MNRLLVYLILVSALLTACRGPETTPLSAVGNASQKPPIVLEEHRVFYTPGRIEAQAQPGLEQYEILVGQAYVEAFIPQQKHPKAFPIIMTHASSTGIIWLTTPDGRE